MSLSFYRITRFPAEHSWNLVCSLRFRPLAVLSDPSVCYISYHFSKLSHLHCGKAQRLKIKYLLVLSYFDTSHQHTSPENPILDLLVSVSNIVLLGSWTTPLNHNFWFRLQLWLLQPGHLRNKPLLDIKIHSDSEYVISCMNGWIHAWGQNGWTTAAGHQIRNRDLMEEAF